MSMTWMWWWNVQDGTVVGTGSEVSGPGERGQGILMLAPVRLARFVKREREREREESERERELPARVWGHDRASGAGASRPAIAA